MSLLLALGALALAILSQAVLVRLCPRLPRVPSMVIAGAPVGLGLLGILAALGADLPHIVAAALVYALGIELYVFLFTLVANSVTLGLAMRLGAHYDTMAMVARRIDQLQGARLLESDGRGGWRATARGARLVASFDRLRRFFRHPEI